MDPLPSLLPERPSAARDLLMTTDRKEQKILLEPHHGPELTRTLDFHLKRHLPPGALRLPGAQQFSTTIYFDTADRHLFTEASEEDSSVKLRAREYYTVDPSLVQLAKRADQLVRFDPVLWFEVKHKQGSQVTKQRFSLSKHEVPGFLHDGRITKEIGRLQVAGHRQQAMLGIAELCCQYDAPFVVDCIVNYRRIAWQDAMGTLRLTFDQHISFFAPPNDIWTRKLALTRESLGPARGVLPRAILEVKTRGRVPDWLAKAIAAADGEELDFSKFVSASSAVHDS